MNSHSRFYKRPLLSSLTIILGGIGMIWGGVRNVWSKEGVSWDAPFMLTIHRLHTPVLNAIMKTVTLAGELGAALVTGGALLWLGRHHRWREAAALLICVIGAAAFNGLLKLLIARPRPSVFPPLVNERTYSFPSGHTITAVALYGFLTVLLWRQDSGWALLTGALIPAVGFSRIYLGVHYPSDVIAAMTLGAVWLAVVIIGLTWRLQLQGVWQ